MSYEQNTRSNFDSVEKKFREHVAGAYNGTVQSFEDASTPFDELYHDDFASSILQSKSEFRHRVKFLMSVGTKGELVYFQPLDNTRFEYKLHLANRAIDFTFHGIGTISKDGKITKLEPCNDSNSTTSQIVKLFQLNDLVDNMYTHERVNNSSTSTRADIKKSVDSIFSTNFEGNIDGESVDFQSMKDEIDAGFAERSTIHFDKVIVIDVSRIEIVITKQNDWRRHQVLTVVDGKIARIETIKDAHDLVYYLEAYERVQNSRDSTRADMEKAFNNVFHDELKMNIDGIGTGLGKVDARKLVFTDFEEKANIKFDKIKVINAAQVEIVITKQNDWRRHQVLGVKDGKIVTLQSVADVNDFVYNLKEYMKVMNSSESTLQDLEKIFNLVFDEELYIESIPTVGSGLGKADAKKLIFTDFVQKAKLSFDKIVVLDSAHVEVVISKQDDWTRHQVLTVKNGKMVKLVTVPDGVACGKEVTVTFAENSEPVSAQ